jgi:hypothetical protein
VADIVGPGDFPDWLAVRAALQRLLHLMRGELGLLAHLHPSRPGAIPAFACPRADQLALKLGQSSEDGQYQPPVRGRRVGPCVTEGPEPRLALGDRCQSVEQVAG